MAVGGFLPSAGHCAELQQSPLTHGCGVRLQFLTGTTRGQKRLFHRHLRRAGESLKSLKVFMFFYLSFS